MRNRRLISLTLCLLMLSSLLAGCSTVQEPAVAPGTPAAPAAETAPTPAEESGEAPAAEAEAAAEPTAEPTPEPTEEPAPEEIRLSAGTDSLTGRILRPTNVSLAAHFDPGTSSKK